MIGRIHGIIIEKQPPEVLIDVQGIGYEVQVPMSTLYDLPAVGETVMLKAHLVVREDAQVLYGFGSETERQLFRQLIKISGVGAKLALAILSGVSVAEFTHLVQSRDAQSLTKLPGVGKKTAERLVVEMADKLGAIDSDATSVAGVPSTVNDPQTEAKDALVALGYKPAEIQKLIKTIDVQGLSSEEIIRKALQGSIVGNRQ